MIAFNLHIMWYEYMLVTECLDSLQNALQFAEEEVEVHICINNQTYLEEPEYIPDTMKAFSAVRRHPLFKEGKITEVVLKSDEDPFYNIADWRREKYFPEAEYTVWGETDTIMPRELFSILENIPIDQNHVISFASRPMWDNSWDDVTHDALQGYSKPCKCPADNHKADCIELLEAPWKYKDIITQEELDKFNEGRAITITQVLPKVDGSLLCLSGNLPTPFLPADMHFVREDTCFERYMVKRGIPHLCITSILKGHNYKHPNKRVGTKATRDDEVFKQYAEQSQQAMINFLHNL